MARKFLYGVAAIIALIIAGAIAYQLFPTALTRMALVPGEDFAAPASRLDYAQASLWIDRPDLAPHPASWKPANYASSGPPPALKAAIFFAHPTTYLNRAHWNAPLDDADANLMARNVTAGQASVFAPLGPVWAPRYRQATLGAFLTEKPEGKKALDAAYADVLAAFDHFIAQIPADQPIILAGHSQGSLHLIRLMRERVYKQPLAQRIVAAYLVGWPISREVDQPMLGLDACAMRQSTGCILSWQTFADPADTGMLDTMFDSQPGLNGKSRKGTVMLCVNPASGTLHDEVGADAERGYTPVSYKLEATGYRLGRPAARCGKRGYLIVRNPPNVGAAIMPGNNYHVYDYALFWADIAEDARARLAAFETQ